MDTLKKNKSYGLIMVTYLLGIFMGAIDTGIVTPARTVIQNNLQVDDKTGIWMITIYTLAYAASIPIMGKLADKFGRKYIYLSSIFLFGLGSLFCGLSQNFDSFTLLLISRAVQAIGGGGIVPVATAEFGTTFPQEKRGMALGLVGGVYGIANIFGATAGSAILDLFGTDNWQFIFYVNVPITMFILIVGFVCLPNTKEINVRKIDFWGITVLTVMVLSILYGLKNIDFFDFNTTIQSTSVYPFLILFVMLLPLFIFAEKKAEDPVMNLSYFKNIRIIVTLIISFITGVVIMGMIFVPQFSENAIKIPSGEGGYFVLILGIFAGIGAPVSGKLIDKYGVKIVLGFGFVASVIGSLYLNLITANHPSLLNVIVCLILIGVGIGFTMGTPINYMMLDNTKKEESNSALATVSLVRSIGTAIAPAIMIGFISHAGMAVQPNVMAILPASVSVPELPYAQELTDKLNELKTNEKTKAQFADMDIPDLTSMKTMDIKMNSDSNYKMPEDLLELMQSSDVTTITENCKKLSTRMFAEMTPNVITGIQSGMNKGITGIDSGIAAIDRHIAELQSGYNGISAGVAGQEEGLRQLETLKTMLSSMPAGAFNGKTSIKNLIPENVKSKIPQTALEMLADVYTLEDIDNMIAKLNKTLEETKASQAGMKVGLDGMNAAKAEMAELRGKMVILKDSVPGAFETAKNNYLNEIDNHKAEIETEFQKTMNSGFKQVYLTVAIASVFALLILAFYKDKKKIIVV